MSITSGCERAEVSSETVGLGPMAPSVHLDLYECAAVAGNRLGLDALTLRTQLDLFSNSCIDNLDMVFFSQNGE